ncbi:MAG: hypothetical protein M8353_10325 [ANME-2 cluster archaeon]|nr:hypothetical protein [ANME-2 cluster archaeon]
MENKMVFGSPKKTIDNSIKKIEKGHGSRKIVDSLKKALKEDSGLIEDTALTLIGIIQTDKKETFSYCLEPLLDIAETETDLLVNSTDAFINIIQIPDDNALDNNSILISLDILSIIVSLYPELMQPAVPALLKKMRSSNSQIRSASYYILDIISKSHPDFFSNHTLDLIRSLNGLNIDERVYATKLIGEIAKYSPNVIDDSYEVLNDLASKHPSSEVRQEAYDVLKKYGVDEETPEGKTEEHKPEPLEFEKDFIGIDDINSEDMDFAELADDLSERIKGIDFEASAVEMLKSLQMDHLIVKPEYRTKKPSAEAVEATAKDSEDAEKEDVVPKKLPPKLHIENKFAHKPELQRIEQLVMDPNIKPRLSPVKEITQKNGTKHQEPPATESVDDEIEVPKTNAEVEKIKTEVTETEIMNQGFTKRTDIEVMTESETKPQTVETISVSLPSSSIEMIHAIFTEIITEDWIRNIGLVNHDGNLITAINPKTLDQNLLQKIIDMLNLEKNLSYKEGFRNRISIELSDKVLVAMSINIEYIMVVFTKSNIQFGMVLYQLDRIAEKLEQIIA